MAALLLFLLSVCPQMNSVRRPCCNDCTDMVSPLPCHIGCIGMASPHSSFLCVLVCNKCSDILSSGCKDNICPVSCYYTTKRCILPGALCNKNSRKRFCEFDDLKKLQNQCGSYEAIEHIPRFQDRIRVSTKPNQFISPLFELGGPAALHTSSTDMRSSTAKCGAILISDRYLLTAAHCMASKEHRLTGISLGRDNLDENTSNGIDNYVIQETHIHPNYNRSSGTNYNDIAILKTNRKVIYSKKIWPYCLPDKNQVLDDFLPVVIAGWGHVNQTHTTSSIKTAFVRLVESSRCESLFHAQGIDHIIKFQYPNGLANKILCAGRNGVDACEGDSGGPMSHKDRNGIQTAIGIVSNGIANCPEFPTIPGFYTNISNFIDWIYDT
ncbi:unnamed protein product, partial [Meganyctiphanes norvegica]